MKKTSIVLSLVLLLPFIIQAQKFNIKHVYPIEVSHSYVNFIATYMGYAKVRGSLDDFNGSIYYDPENLEQTSVSFLIKVNSIDSNNDWRDKDLKSANWFEAEKYPNIQFTSTSIKLLGEKLQVEGDLSIKETTKSISFSISKPLGILTDIRGDSQVIFEGSYTLKRKEYGVMGNNWSQVKEGITALSDEIVVEFSMLGKQINQGNFLNFFKNQERPHGSILAAYQKEGLTAALAQFDVLHKEGKANAKALNLVAYMLMKQDKDQDALVLMEKNQEIFPDDANVYDSLGELYAKMGKMKLAKKQYQKALEMNADNMNAAEVLKHL